MARVKGCRPPTLAGTATLVGAIAMLNGCAPPAVVCAGSRACAGSNVCIAGGCAPPTATPVPRLTQRILVPASEVAVLLSGDFPPATAAPSMAPLGAETAGQVTMLLRFPIPWGDAPVSRAFLLLGPAARATPQASPVAIEVASVTGSWSAGSTRWSNRPSLAPPLRRAWVTTFPAHLVRVDVTELVGRPHGSLHREIALAVSAAPQGESGAAVATGLDGDDLPRLDVYLQ